MNYDEVQELKFKHDIFEFNYIKPMAIRLYSKKTKLLLKCFIQAMLFEPDIICKDNHSDVLISYAFKFGIRKDYDSIILKLKSIVNNYNEIFFLYKLNIFKIPVNLYIFFKNFMFTDLKKRMSIKDRMKIISLGITIHKIKETLEKINFKEKLLISFCDAHFEENILTQIFKKDCTRKAITLQHGQYRFMENGSEDENTEAYMNFISDYIFVWGEKTKNELIRGSVDSERIVIVGALKDFKRDKKEIIKNNIFCLILDGETNKNSNLSMIKLSNIISKKLNKKYFIRFHPMNKKTYYESYVLKDNYINSNDSNQAEFFILHKTSVLLEMLRNNYKIFIYNDESQDDIFKIDDILFSNYEEFQECYDKDIGFNYVELYKSFNIEDSLVELEINYNSSIRKIMYK